MTAGRYVRMAQGALAVIAGVSLGFGVSGLERSSIVLAVVLTLLATAGEWLEVRLGPLGTVTLRPVVAFVGLWNGGPALFLLVGLAPPLLRRLVLDDRALLETLTALGRDALALWFAYAIHVGAHGWLSSPVAHGSVTEVAMRLAAILSFWGVQFLLQSAELAVSESIHFRSVLRHLLRRAWAHVSVLAAATVVLSYFAASFGLFVMALATVMLVEAYYPWKLLGEQRGVLLTSLQMMAQAVDLKDPYTSNHSQRVATYAVRLARAMGLSEDEVERVRVGALMHDIGKIGISGRIIRKPGKLTAEEQALMWLHPKVSASIIEHLEILGESAQMVRHHHERWDGTGYPDGLKGEEIPLGSRIILVADAFDALVTTRPYRKGASRAEALEVIRQHAGTQFDPAVVETFQRTFSLL
jgi:putative nucleotidyltransferase with HDIG domain